MGLNVEIGHIDLKAVVERKKGFLGLNTGKVGCTAPWSSLQLVGLSDVNGSNTRQIILVINQGSLTNRNISKYFKAIFKNEILPAIKIFIPECGDAFHLTLDYREGVLLKTVLTSI
jgi:hypothetical protein